MVQKSMGYDSPVYQEVITFPLNGTGLSTLTSAVAVTVGVAASAQSAKFTAFTNMLVKSLTASASIVSTSSVASNGVIFYRITNNGTTAVNTVTATYTLSPTGVPGPAGAAVTTAAYVVNHVPGTGVSTSAATANALLSTNVLGGSNAYAIPMLQGDLGYIIKGTDATEALMVAVEAVIQPLANVTA